MTKVTKYGIAIYMLAGLLVFGGAMAKIQHAPVANLLLLVGVALSPIGLAFLLFGFLKKIR
jgi:hypothetical protein